MPKRIKRILLEAKVDDAVSDPKLIAIIEEWLKYGVWKVTDESVKLTSAVRILTIPVQVEGVTMSHSRYPLPIKNSVRQPDVLGFKISWNPDDNRYYVHANSEKGEAGGEVLATFQGSLRGWQNLVQYCKRRATKEQS